MDSCVLQSWVQELPMKMQSVLMLGLRGPDTHRADEVKKIGRWLRGLVLKPADPDNLPFMNAWLPEQIQEKSAVAKELEFCTQHYYSHLMHTLEIVGYYHPNQEIANHAELLYKQMCLLFHMPFETKLNMAYRLRQKSWPNGSQPENFVEALQVLKDSGQIIKEAKL